MENPLVSRDHPHSYPPEPLLQAPILHKSAQNNGNTVGRAASATNAREQVNNLSGTGRPPSGNGMPKTNTYGV
jgi:hypothetical protein